MRKTIVLLASVALALGLAAGAALAADIVCPTGPNGLCEGTAQDDRLDGTPDVDTMRGFGGKDRLYGSGGRDHLAGGPDADRLMGMAGNDELLGQDGNDILGDTFDPLSRESGEQATEPGKDTFMGGPGKDAIAARDKTHDTINCGKGSADLAIFDGQSLDSVNSNCERRDWTNKELPSCAPKPWDNASVKCKNGNNDANRLVGRDDPDPRMVDAIRGAGGNDTLIARRGFDGLVGGVGNDILWGGPGDDGLFGDRSGTSVLGDEGIDELHGGGGDDFIYAIDGNQDTIACGPGEDWAQIDRDIDVVVGGCESVTDEPEAFFHWWRKVMRRR